MLHGSTSTCLNAFYLFGCCRAFQSKSLLVCGVAADQVEDSDAMLSAALCAQPLEVNADSLMKVAVPSTTLAVYTR